jgi:integrase
MKKLTDRKISNLKPKNKRYEVADGKGLVIRVTPTGSKTWFFRYLFDDKPRIMKLGDYPGLGLADARSKHEEARKDIQRDIDPGEKAKELKNKLRGEPTFQGLFDEFWEKELSKSITADERRRLVDKDIMPIWGNRKVASITRRDVVLALDVVRERAPVGANRLQGVLIRLFNFAAERGVIPISPLIGMRRGKEKSRERVLTDTEIKLFWESMSLEQDDIDIFHVVKLALKAVLLTGQRPGEIVSMKWEQIKNNLWTIPAALRKNGEENIIPILPMMKSVIYQAKKYSGDSAYVFTSPQKNNEQITVGAMANAIRRHREEIGIPERFTPHDLRRTLRTKLAEIKVTDIVAEKVLGHKLPGVLGIYNRNPYVKEKRHALTLWEKRLKKILKISEPKTNVIILSEVQR